MKKQESGVLVVEASISLTAFMFLILFFLSFSHVYRAQEVVSHASFQTAQTLAVDSYFRETVGEAGTAGAITKLSDFIAAISGKGSSGLTDSYCSLGTVKNLKGLFSKEFARSIADDTDKANQILKDLGVVDGISGIDFSGCYIEDSIIHVNVKYKLKLRLNFFGKQTLSLSKEAVCKSFASIKEDNNAPTKPKSGGGGSY